MNGPLATPLGRILAMASDEERIEAARETGERLARQIERAAMLGGPYTYGDSLGGIVTYWPERDPRFVHVQTSEAGAAAHMPAALGGNPASPAAGPVEPDRLRSGPWRP